MKQWYVLYVSLYSYGSLEVMSETSMGPAMDYSVLYPPAYLRYNPGFNKVERGYIGLTLSARPFVPSMDGMVSALYLPQ